MHGVAAVLSSAACKSAVPRTEFLWHDVKNAVTPRMSMTAPANAIMRVAQARKRATSMILFQHKHQPWRTLSGTVLHRGWLFYRVLTLVSGRRRVVRLPRRTWRVGMLPIVDYGLEKDK